MANWNFVVRYVSKHDGGWSWKCFATREEALEFMELSPHIGSDAELFVKE